MCLVKNENLKIIKNNIKKSIKDLSNIELQKLTWAGKHTKLASSFTEILANLYDDFSFESYIEYCKSNNLESKTLSLIIELDRLINKYKNYGYETEMKIDGYKEILNDSKWIAITKKANEIIVEWNR